MRIVPVRGIMTGAEGECPPLPFLTVENGEAASLVTRGLARLYDGPMADPDAPAPVPAEQVITAGVDIGSDSVTVQIFVNGQPHGEPIVEALPVAIAEGDPVAIVNPNGTATPAVIEGGAPAPTGEPAINVEQIDADEAARLAAGGHPADLVEALELIEGEDLVKTGARAGRPKVDAVKAILEREVSAEEIDAAWAAKAAAAE